MNPRCRNGSIPALTAALAWLLSGCASEVTGPNRAPLAVAGADQAVSIGQAAVLDGRDSFDPDGDEMFFRWTLVAQPGGSLAVVSGDLAPQAQLSPDMLGVWVIRLVVGDGQAVSAGDLVVVRSSGCRRDQECDDGLWCNGEETCQQGICLSGTRDCSGVEDGCNDSNCDEDSDQCLAIQFPDGTICAEPSCDGLIWMSNACLAGVCLSEELDDCDDMNVCTRDACFTSGCSYSPQLVGVDCSDSLYCNGNEACDGMGNCLQGQDPCQGLFCDEDQDLCTGCITDDNCPVCHTCVDTICEPQAASTPCGDPTIGDCDNPDTCDGAGTCLPNHLAAGTDCNDFQFCNGADTCDGHGACLHHVGDPCMAGDECNRECNEMDDTCFTALGTACGSPADSDCSNPDSCDGLGACLPNHEPQSVSCDDNLYCNGPDSCDGLGTCGSHAGDPCLGGDACNQLCDETGDHCLDPAGTPCDDGQYCNGTDSCDGLGACNDHQGDPCTGGSECNQNCDETAAGCYDDPAGTPCGDALDDDCTDPDTCDGDGLCLANHQGPGANCDDGQYCNGPDSCDGAGNCVHIGDPCLSGSECNRFCNESDTSCFDALDTPCGDPADTECSDPDSCDGLGACRSNHTTAGTGCDIEPCSSLDACDGGGTCLAGAIDLDWDGDGSIDGLCPGGDDCNDSDYDMSPGWLEGPFGNPYCSDGKDNDCDGLVDVQETDCAAPSACGWWWNVMNHRQRLVVVNRSPVVLEAGYTVVLLLDHQALVQSGQSYSGGGDLRIVWCNGTDNLELDRVDDAVYSLPSGSSSFNSPATRLAFATRADIGPMDADSEYFLYYDPSNSVSGPPADPTRVYLWYDNFTTLFTQSYDTSKWVDLHGDWDEYLAPTFSIWNDYVSFDTGDNYQTSFYPDLPAVADVLVEAIFWSNNTYDADGTVALAARVEPFINGTHYYLDFSHGFYPSPGVSVDTWQNDERNHLVYDEPSAYYWESNEHHTLRYAVFGTTHKFWWNQSIDQPADIQASDATHTGAGRFGFVAGQIAGHVDTLRARRYLEPEPLVIPGPQEP